MICFLVIRILASGTRRGWSTELLPSLQSRVGKVPWEPDPAYGWVWGLSGLYWGSSTAVCGQALLVSWLGAVVFAYLLCQG